MYDKIIAFLNNSSVLPAGFEDDLLRVVKQELEVLAKVLRTTQDALEVARAAPSDSHLAETIENLRIENSDLENQVIQLKDALESEATEPDDIVTADEEDPVTDDPSDDDTEGGGFEEFTSSAD